MRPCFLVLRLSGFRGVYAGSHVQAYQAIYFYVVGSFIFMSIGVLRMLVVVMPYVSGVVVFVVAIRCRTHAALRFGFQGFVRCVMFLCFSFSGLCV